MRPKPSFIVEGNPGAVAVVFFRIHSGLIVIRVAEQTGDADFVVERQFPGQLTAVRIIIAVDFDVIAASDKERAFSMKRSSYCRYA